ncbi:MAG: 3'-5' exonuclease [Saprospiraceae bacterium]|nr:3'-5' exonuclease [Saprospiraceae bacterium]
MNPFQLKKDLIFLDLETTGVHVIRDRIVQIAMIKYRKNEDKPIEYNQIVNPGIPIPDEAYKVHGIGPAEVANKPTFKELAKELYDFIGEADLAGYNSLRFDIPLLAEEFYRYGYDLELEKRKLVDVQRIFYKMEPRTLKAAYQFYCGKDLVNAHDAMADTKATVDVLIGQLSKYQHSDFTNDDGLVIANPVRNDVKALDEFTNDLGTLDPTQRLKLNDKSQIVFNFGKYINKTLDEVWEVEQNYFNWILDKEFSYQVKKIIQNYLSDKKDQLNRRERGT